LSLCPEKNKETENTKTATMIPEKYTVYKSVENRNQKERK